MKPPVLLLLALALALAGCGGDSEETDPRAKRAGAATVEIRDFEFTPATVTVRAGARVTFVNRDKAPHTAQTDLDSSAGEFDTGRLGRGEERTVTLRDPGRFSYFCAFHPFMKGALKVVE